MKMHVPIAPGEFYQLDMELAFATQEDVLKLMSGFYIRFLVSFQIN